MKVRAHWMDAVTARLQANAGVQTNAFAKPDWIPIGLNNQRMMREIMAGRDPMKAMG